MYVRKCGARNTRRIPHPAAMHSEPAASPPRGGLCGHSFRLRRLTRQQCSHERGGRLKIGGVPSGRPIPPRRASSPPCGNRGQGEQAHVRKKEAKAFAAAAQDIQGDYPATVPRRIGQQAEDVAGPVPLRAGRAAGGTRRRMAGRREWGRSGWPAMLRGPSS
jgi:hypothetical protein